MLSRTLRWLILVMVSALPAAAQTMDDGSMMPKRTLSLGVLSAHDSWDQYWEGTLKRSNGNIGTLTTQSVTMVTGYSVSDRLALVAALPYVWTHASQGVLHDMSGVQDLAIGARFKLLSSAQAGTVRSAPSSEVWPRFLPVTTRRTFTRCRSGPPVVERRDTSRWASNPIQRGSPMPPLLICGAAT